VIETILLTVVSDIDFLARIKNDVGVFTVEASGVLGAVFGLDAETESISAQVYQVSRRETHPCTIERRLRAGGTGDRERVLGEGTQDSAGIFEELDWFVTSVGNGRDDIHILRSIALEAEERGYDGQDDVDKAGAVKTGVGKAGGGSRDGNRGGDEGDEGGTEGRGKHCDEGSEGG